MDENLYKVLGKNGEAVNGGKGKWKRNGHWMSPVVGDLVPCRTGYHLCRRQDLTKWLGPTIWSATYRGERLDLDDKVVVREARLIQQIKSWDEIAGRLFGIDCAERVMHLGDEVLQSSVLAIAYLYAIGEATKEVMEVAEDVAWFEVLTASKETTRRGAAWPAAKAAAGYAPWEASQSASLSVAWATTKDMTDVAWKVALTAEREWQTERLMEYLGCEDDG